MGPLHTPTRCTVDCIGVIPICRALRRAILYISKTALDLVVGLERLRASYPELEHFSLLLRELHNDRALSLVLHVRDVAERLLGLRLRDLKNRCEMPPVHLVNRFFRHRVI